MRASKILLPSVIGLVYLVAIALCLNSCSTADDHVNLDVRIAAEGIEDRPNIILIMADDLGIETVGAYGGQSYSTPNIDSMASMGMRFDHCYSQPLCTPSRVKLMTGIYNIRNYVRFGYLDEDQTTFAHLFKKAGYATCISGKWQLGKNPNSPMNFGFDNHCLWLVTESRNDSIDRDTRYSQPILQEDGVVRSFNKDDYGPYIVSNYGLDFITKCHEDGQPFLWYYPMILPHWPHCPTPRSEDWLQTSATEESQYGVTSYFPDMIFEMDSIVGVIDMHLERLGIQDNTLVIFIGDNGTYMDITSRFNDKEIKGGKRSSTDAGTHVPFIAKWPGKITRNSVCDDLIDFSDFLPSMLDAAGLELIDNIGIDGISFFPQMKSEKGAPRLWTYNWFSFHGKLEEAKVFARTKRYKLYGNGDFFDIKTDNLEEHPLVLKELDSEVQLVHQTLQDVFLGYKERRGENLVK